MALVIDGSQGEAGGQILRTALGLSALTGKEILVKNIRKGRPRPGLQAQHLTALNAMKLICKAQVQGAKRGSMQISFAPKEASPISFFVNIGTAGSISLLLQSVLFPALKQEIKIRVLGGTNVPFSPPIEFLHDALFFALKKMNAKFDLELNARGYFPKGNGSVSFSSKPARLPLKPIFLAELGKLEFVKIYSHCASLPKELAINQALGAKKALPNLNVEFVEKIECREKSSAEGSGISLFAHYSTGAVLCGSALWERGKDAIKVGKEAAQNLLKEINAGKAVDSHLADQLIPFMALASEASTIECSMLTRHCLTNISITEQFLPVKFEVKGSLGMPAEIFVQGICFK